MSLLSAVPMQLSIVVPLVAAFEPWWPSGISSSFVQEVVMSRRCGSVDKFPAVLGYMLPLTYWATFEAVCIPFLHVTRV